MRPRTSGRGAIQVHQLQLQFLLLAVVSAPKLTHQSPPSKNVDIFPLMVRELANKV